MAEDLKKKQPEQLQEEQLDDVNGGIAPGVLQNQEGNLNINPGMPI